MGAGDLGWDDFVKGLHDALPAFLANFVRLRALADEPGDPALVALVGRVPFVLIVNPALPIHSIPELIAYAKQHKLLYASGGAGSARPGRWTVCG